MQLKTLLALFCALYALTAKADVKPRLHYYPNKFRQIVKSDRLKSKTLRLALRQVISSPHVRLEDKPDVLVEICSQNNKKCFEHISLGYKKARKILFGALHLKKDNHGYYVEDVYCKKTFTNRVGPGRIPPHDGINCEHTWPQSRFTERYPREMQKSDLHHLFPTDSVANSTRGNHPFGMVNGLDAGSDCASSQVGPTIARAGHGTFFEPPRDHRGNVARALFYFAVRYDKKIDPIQEQFLRKWHEEDPVDAEEMRRNNLIEKFQGNRNPFIDLPKLTDKISDF